MQQASHKTRIKFCGMRRAQDVRMALQLGVDYIGFVLVPGVSRSLTAEQVLQIQSEVDCSNVCRVGVFRDQLAPEINTLVARLSLDLVQLHGTEDSGLSAQIDVPVIRMIAVPGDESLPQSSDLLAEALEQQNIYAFLLDASRGEKSGGLGLPLDPTRLAEMRAQIPAARRLIVAGGLTPQNVRAIVRDHQPDVVDVSSGIETRPGGKDESLMRTFVEAVRGEQVS